MTSLRVALVDHQRVFAEALADQLSREDDVVVVGIATNTEEVRDLLLRGEIDVLALDFDIPGGDGLELGRAALRQRPDLALVVVTGNVDRPHVLEAVRSGVLAWVPKDSSYVELLSALRAAARGETRFPAAVFRIALDEQDAD